MAPDQVEANISRIPEILLWHVLSDITEALGSIGSRGLEAYFTKGS